MTSGFAISQLLACGPKMLDAEISFSAGLNVVSGASDTGKSYIFECLQYMLGGRNPPDSVPEDEGYDTLYLELLLHDGAVVTLQRSLKQGGDYLIHSRPFAEIESSDEEPEKLSSSASAKSSLPSRLLSYCGLLDKQIRTNKTGKTRPFHFSDLRHFMMIGEARIIDKRTPVHPIGMMSRTAELSAFDFILSGEDSSSVIDAGDIKLAKAEWNGKSAVLTELIEELKAELPYDDLIDVTSRLTVIQGAIEISSQTIQERSSELREFLISRKANVKTAQVSRSRLATIDQLTRKFQLLTQHYQSDLERLEFVSESDFYLSQIGSGHCPVCGNLIEKHTAEQLESEKETEEGIQEAASKEVEKLKVQLGDLADTMRSLTKEQTQLESEIVEIDSSIRQTNQSISENLEPELTTARDEIQQLYDTKNTLRQMQKQQERILILEGQLEDIGPEPKRKTTDKISDLSLKQTVSVSKARRRFCNALAARLERWKFPSVGTVEFDSDHDVVVDGQARTTHGKGIRAVLHTAFTATLMTEFKQRHSHVVVVDSPLTSFKEKDDYSANEDIQMGFYQDMFKLSDDEQVIVLENKDPPKILIDKMTYYHFSGVIGNGRQGFYPNDIGDNRND